MVKSIQIFFSIIFLFRICIQSQKICLARDFKPIETKFKIQKCTFSLSLISRLDSVSSLSVEDIYDELKSGKEIFI